MVFTNHLIRPIKNNEKGFKIIEGLIAVALFATPCYRNRVIYGQCIKTLG